MSIEYYLFSKKKYEEILFHLDEIIETYHYLNIIEYEDKNKLFNVDKNKNFFIGRKNEIIEYISKCNYNIKKLCNHIFVEDYIDISEEKSKKIKYCQICEYTQ